MRVIERDTRILPFGDLVGDLPCLDRTFAAFRDHELEASGAADRLTVVDAAFVSAPLLRAFVAAAEGPSRLAVPRTSVLRSYVPASSVEDDGELLLFDVFCDAEGDLEALRASARPVVIDPIIRTRRREWPRVGPPPHHIELVDDGLVAMHVEHWAHVLWLWPALVRRLQKRATKNVIGKGVKIHPSADIEGSVIGDDVEIGASCVVHHSYVGARSQLSDFTKVAYSVLGDGTHTLADASFYEMVALGGGTLTSLTFRDSILGRNVFLTTGVIFWHDVLEGSVAVEKDGAWIDTGRKVLGGCAGHGAVLGARTILAPGRALPNRTTVVMRKEEGVFSIHDAPPGTPMCWHEAAMVPVAEVDPGYLPDEVA